MSCRIIRFHTFYLATLGLYLATFRVYLATFLFIVPLYRATFRPGYYCDPKLGQFIYIELCLRISVLLKFSVGFRNSAIVFVHYAKDFHRFGKQRIPIVIHERKIVWLGSAVKSARIGYFNPVLLVLVKLDWRIPRK